jgi:hypothetical protein
MSETIGSKKILSLSTFPSLGSSDKDYYYLPEDSIKYYNENNMNLYKNENVFSDSNYVHDLIINSHPRFGFLTKNIRERKGKKVNIKLPIYYDRDTNVEMSTDDEPYPGFIHMDAMAFGMGNCCFQITVGASSLQNSLFMYDQLVPLTPLLVKTIY